MKNLRKSFFSVLAVVLLASCTKNDFTEEGVSVVNSSTAATAGQNLRTADWESSTDWKTVNQEDFSVYYINIEDADITAAIADEGLVLVYKKDDSKVVSLPFEDETPEHKTYWYSQVTEGNLLISCDAYGISDTPGAETSFKYIILSKEDLSKLEGRGYSQEQLLNMSYDEASKIAESK